MRKLIVATTFVLVAAALASSFAARQSSSAKPTKLLEHSAPSRDALIERFLEALSASDAQKLRELRVTEREYVDIFIPGSVDKGKPLRPRFSDEINQYYWGILDGKSRYYERYLLGEFGGRKYRVKSIEFAKGTKGWEAYNAFQQLRLSMEGPSGEETKLATGSIIEVDGQYKFMSYIRD